MFPKVRSRNLAGDLVKQSSKLTFSSQWTQARAQRMAEIAGEMSESAKGSIGGHGQPRSMVSSTWPETVPAPVTPQMKIPTGQQQDEVIHVGDEASQKIDPNDIELAAASLNSKAFAQMKTPADQQQEQTLEQKKDSELLQTLEQCLNGNFVEPRALSDRGSTAGVQSPTTGPKSTIWVKKRMEEGCNAQKAIA